MGCCSSYLTPTAYSWGEGVNGSLGDYQRNDHYTSFPFPIRGLPMTLGEQADKLFSVRRTLYPSRPFPPPARAPLSHARAPAQVPARRQSPVLTRLPAHEMNLVPLPASLSLAYELLTGPAPLTYPRPRSPTHAHRITQGYHNGFAILKNGRLQAWGRNNFGLCGNGRVMEIDAIHEAEAEGSCNVRERTVRSSPPETSCGSPLHVTLRSSPPSSLPGGQLQVPSPCSPSPSHHKPQPPVVDMDHATCTHAAVPAPQCPTAAMRPAYNALPFSCFAVVCMRGMRALRCPAHVVASGPIPHTRSLRPPPAFFRKRALAPSLSLLSLSLLLLLPGTQPVLRLRHTRQRSSAQSASGRSNKERQRARDRERETGSERYGARERTNE